MKLVEILARGLNVWPSSVSYVWQSPSSGNILCNELGALYQFEDIADDACERVGEGDEYGQNKVTKEQWQAERDRINKNKQPTQGFRDIAQEWSGEIMVHADEAIINTTEKQWSNECEKQYEQELWDKVAAEVFVDVLAISATSEGGAICACNAADAFMAERAKRMKDNQKT